jgi:hypothetical protein
MEFGIQKATIQSSFITTKENGTIEVCHKLLMKDGRTDYTRIYITKASAGIARAQFSKCGYDGDDFTDILEAIDADGEALKGNEVDVDVFMNDYNNKPKVEIVTERPKAGKEALQRAAQLLKSAKKGDDTPPPGDSDGDIPF